MLYHIKISLKVFLDSDDKCNDGNVSNNDRNISGDHNCSDIGGGGDSGGAAMTI